MHRVMCIWDKDSRLTIFLAEVTATGFKRAATIDSVRVNSNKNAVKNGTISSRLVTSNAKHIAKHHPQLSIC
jgi:hypothetical protein